MTLAQAAETQGAAMNAAISSLNQTAVATLNKPRTGIVVDASCDLPASFFLNTDVAVLPITVRIGRQDYVDRHNAHATDQFIREGLGGKGADAETIPMTAAELATFFQERFVLDFDSVYCLTVSATRSPIYDNAMSASSALARTARSVREAAGISRPFQLRIIDTRNAMAAQGIAALELQDLIDRNHAQMQIRTRLYEVIDATYGYLLPDDLYYLRARLSAKGDKSVGRLSAALGSALDIKPIIQGRLGKTGPVAKIRGREEALVRLFRFCSTRVQRGLLCPHLSVSYGGPLDELRALPGYEGLVNACQNENVRLHESVMSITGMINVGQRAVSIGFAAPDHNPEF
jgi:DegV family protein with EDD domain